VIVVVLAVFWGGREGFQTLLNTKVHDELSHMASFFRMAVGKLLLCGLELKLELKIIAAFHSNNKKSGCCWQTM